MDVLQERAIERGTHLNIVEVLAAVHGLDIKPAEHFQRQNASSAVRLAEPVPTRLGMPPPMIAASPTDFLLCLVKGLRTWIGKGDARPWSRVSSTGIWMVLTPTRALKSPALGLDGYQGPDTCRGC